MNIFNNNIKRIFGNKVKLSILLLAPIMFTLLFAFGAFETITIGIVDLDQSELTNQFIENLEKNEFYNVRILKEDDIKASVTTYDVDYAIKIEEGFSEKLINQEDVTINEYYFIENPNIYNVKNYIESYLLNLKTIAHNTQGDKTLFIEVLNDYEHGSLEVNNLENNQAKIARSIMVMGLTVYFLVFVSVLTCGIILEDRVNGTLLRIFNSPISLKKYLFENILSFIVIAAIQLLLLLLVDQFIFKFYFGSGFLYIYILLFVFSIVSISMGLFVVSIVKKPLQAYLTVGLLASPLCMLGGCYWPIDMMPTWLQNVGKFIPTYWAMTSTTEIITNGKFINVLDDIGIMLLFAAVFFAAGLINKREYAKA